MNRDNPQEIGLIAWLAGIIDGEGSIGLLVGERKERARGIDIRVQPKVIIANTDTAIIDRCQEAFLMIGVGHYVRHERRPACAVVGVHVKTFKAVTTLEVSGLKRVHTLLTATIPWLVGDKKERARLLLVFLQRRFDKVAVSKTTSTNLKYDEGDIQAVLAFLRKTRTKRIEHVTKILNEHTQDAIHVRRLARRRVQELEANQARNVVRKQARKRAREAMMCSDLA